MNKNIFFIILKMSIFMLIIMYLYVLSKFDFDINKVEFISLFKWLPSIFVALWIGYYLGKMNK